MSTCLQKQRASIENRSTKACCKAKLTSDKLNPPFVDDKVARWLVVTLGDSHFDQIPSALTEITHDVTARNASGGFAERGMSSESRKLEPLRKRTEQPNLLPR